jgi:ATP-binding cassette, subfamily B, bacterial
MHAPVLWQNAVVLQRLTARKEWQFFAVLPKADPGLAAAWWVSLLLRGILPAAFAIAMGVLVGAVQRGSPLAGPSTCPGCTRLTVMLDGVEVV